MANLEFDAEAARRTEAVYATPDVVEQRRIVLDLLGPQPGERALDVGVGPGYLAAQIAAAVGPDGRVCGIDISDDMLAIAQRRESAPGSAGVELAQGSANQIPYPDGTFDLAVSTQVLEYVEDVPGALAEIGRVLRPGGRVLILDTDWDSLVWHSGDRDLMRRVQVAWRQHLVDPYLPRTLGPALRAAGFAVDRPTVVPMFNVGYAAQAFSVGLIPLVARFVEGRDGLTAADVDRWQSDLSALGEDYFCSLNRYVFRARLLPEA